MSYEECWRNSLNRYLAIMDTLTDDIPALVEEIAEPIDPECEIEIITKRGDADAQSNNNGFRRG